ncbi:hypothetical protein EJ110_NYTH38556 [Nymphaea thermarum]|nr:hypothetical protein EJ110_NYTH38556 [Nymphaea thermarum]
MDASLFGSPNINLLLQATMNRKSQNTLHLPSLMKMWKKRRKRTKWPIIKEAILSDEDNECFILKEAMHTTSGGRGGGRIIKNCLYNLTVDFEISEVKTFSVRFILDTGATTCCIDENSVPKEAQSQRKPWKTIPSPSSSQASILSKVPTEN